MSHLSLYFALALFALLAVWLALEPLAGRAKPSRSMGLAERCAVACLSAVLTPLTFDPLLTAYLSASGQGREGISKRTIHGSSKRARYFRGVRRLLRDVGFSAAFAALFRPAMAQRFAFPIAGADGATDVLDDVELTEGEKALKKEIGEQVDKLQGQLVERLKGITVASGADREEVEKREAELKGHVDKLIGLAQKEKSTEVTDFERELAERLGGLEKQLEKLGKLPVSDPAGAVRPKARAQGDRYKSDSENLFLDMREAVKRGDHKLAEAIREHEEKFADPERQKAWASEDLEDVDLIVPEIQQALPFLRAQARAVQLFREIRTGSPAVEFPVFKTGLTVGHVKEGEAKPESDPEFDLEVARVFTIAGISDVPNPTLEDFPAARGWIATELGAATGAQEEVDVLLGDGAGEPLGLLKNADIPTRAVDAVAEASAGRNLITSIFRGAQQVRVNGHMEPTDGLVNPAVWTDIALSFEDSIGFLYGVNSNTAGGPAEAPPPRILGLPITWSAYVPNTDGEGEDESPIVVGNFMDGIVLRRSPFRIDIDTSVGFKKNLTSFRGEERMGFIVVRPKSFVKITGAKPSPVEGE
jgi:HK97 family phage major capsid protein